jgi:hypothetical protein
MEQVPLVIEGVMREAGFQASASIAAARVTTVALDRLGVSGAVAVACQLDAVTPATLEMLQSACTRGIPLDELSKAEQEEWERRGAVWVSLIDQTPGRSYSGHVVTVLDDGWLLDPTLAQASRPDRGMPLGPSAFRLDDLAGPISIRLDSGATLMYRLDRAHRGFRAAPAWRDVPRLQATVSRVVEGLSDSAGHD